MSRLPYKVSSPRSANQVSASQSRIESADGQRWATGRYVKRYLPDHRWEPVEVWTLKRRDNNGRAAVYSTQRTRAEAERWVNTGSLS